MDDQAIKRYKSYGWMLLIGLFLLYKAVSSLITSYGAGEFIFEWKSKGVVITGTAAELEIALFLAGGIYFTVASARKLW